MKGICALFLSVALVLSAAAPALARGQAAAMQALGCDLAALASGVAHAHHMHAGRGTPAPVAPPVIAGARAMADAGRQAGSEGTPVHEERRSVCPHGLAAVALPDGRPVLAARLVPHQDWLVTAEDLVGMDGGIDPPPPRV